MKNRCTNRTEGRDLLLRRLLSCRFKLTVLWLDLVKPIDIISAPQVNEDRGLCDDR
jgi:hypothetical protein